MKPPAVFEAIRLSARIERLLIDAKADDAMAMTALVQVIAGILAHYPDANDEKALDVLRASVAKGLPIFRSAAKGRTR